MSSSYKVEVGAYQRATIVQYTAETLNRDLAEIEGKHKHAIFITVPYALIPVLESHDSKFYAAHPHDLGSRFEYSKWNNKEKNKVPDPGHSIQRCMILVFHQDKTLIVEEETRDGETKAKCVTGYVDQGEVPAEAALRELREEVGLDKDSLDLKSLVLFGKIQIKATKGGRPNEEISIFTISTLKDGDLPKIQPKDEVKSTYWMEVAKIPKVDKISWGTTKQEGEGKLWSNVFLYYVANYVAKKDKFKEGWPMLDTDGRSFFY